MKDYLAKQSAVKEYLETVTGDSYHYFSVELYSDHWILKGCDGTEDDGQDYYFEEGFLLVPLDFFDRSEYYIGVARKERRAESEKRSAEQRVSRERQERRDFERLLLIYGGKNELSEDVPEDSQPF